MTLFQAADGSIVDIEKAVRFEKRRDGVRAFHHCLDFTDNILFVGEDADALWRKLTEGAEQNRKYYGSGQVENAA